MPCQDDYPKPDLQPKVNNLTRMLCELCDELEVMKHLDECFIRVLGLKGWWVEHQRRDAERIERERKENERVMLRQSGLNKLTLEEKKVLGL